MTKLALALLFRTLAGPLRAGSPAETVLLDARPLPDFKAGHIEGARSIQWEDFTNAPRSLKGLLLADFGRLAQKLQHMGVGPGRRVIVIGNGVRGWGEEGRIAWMLSYLGIKDAEVMDVGAAQRTLALSVKTSSRRASPWRPRPDKNLRVMKNELAGIVDDAKARVVVIDVRSDDEFHGRKGYGEKRRGHIPGSRNIPWTNFVGLDGTPLNKDALIEVLRRNGVDPTRPLIFYCTGGVRSGYVSFAAMKAGLDARNYDGSFWEWAADPALRTAL